GPLEGLDLTGIGWLIAGGESGPRHRDVRVEWLRSLRDQCIRDRVPFFFKQWGGATSKAGGRVLDGGIWSEMPAPKVGKAQRLVGSGRGMVSGPSSPSSLLITSI